MSPATLVAIRDGMTLLALIGFAALAAALLEWMIWRGTRRLGLPVAPSGGIVDWMAGLGGLASAPFRQGEPPLVALGYAAVIASVVGTAALVAQGIMGIHAPGSLGIIAFAPILCALGYALAAEGALSEEAARHRLVVAGRIVFATPAWAVAVAVWASTGGGQDGSGFAHSTLAPAARAALALVVVWSGQFVLAGSAGELGLAARPWGGDTREASRAVRMITALAHYAGLVAVCVLAATILAGGSRSPGLVAGSVTTGVLALLLRVAATIPGLSRAVREAPRWLVPAVLLVALVLRLEPGRVLP